MVRAVWSLIKGAAGCGPQRGVKHEFTLRRNTETGNESLSLSGSDQVPEGFRQAIEEYYRSLSKKK